MLVLSGRKVAAESKPAAPAKKSGGQKKARA
jgi:hypothetical protein